MPSIIPGFGYDVFISYRQNDNRSGWVTEFVKSLQEELASTIKDPVSVYFDSNPHDGLLETHNVDKSLEGKLNCLILIPIISQTYCDTKSFAWQHEFLAFHKIAKEDLFGRDIRLNNGNVASRILPIKIHDLDDEDKALLEIELGGVLRAIEFIYKEPGVNRPLKSSDNKNDNQNRTDYKNQVNKVANAIKEIVTSLKTPVTQSRQPTKNLHLPTKPIRSKRVMIAISFLLLLAITVYFLNSTFFSSNKGDEILDKSIAVLPFVNLSNDLDQEYFSDGLSEELSTLLSKIPELKVIGRRSSFSFKGKNEDLRIIADKLGVNHILEGTVQKEGNTIRVTAQLIRATDGSQLWSEKYERDLEGIFKLQDEIAGAVVKELKLKLLPRKSIAAPTSINPEIYNLILQGDYFAEKRDKQNVAKAVDFYLKALSLDSLNARSLAGVAKCYSFQLGWGWIDRNLALQKARKAATKAVQLDSTVAQGHYALGAVNMWDFDWDGAEAEYQKALKLEPGNAEFLRIMGFLYRITGRYDESFRKLEQSIDLDPVQAITYLFFGQTFYYTNQFEEAIQSFKTGLELNPLFPRMHLLLGEIYLLQGKPEMTLAEMQQETEPVFKDFGMPLVYFALKRTKEANEALENYVTNYQDSWAYQIARIYAFREERDKAFEWLEKAYARKDSRLIWFKGDPLLKNLESDQRYVAFLKKMNLDD